MWNNLKCPPVGDKDPINLGPRGVSFHESRHYVNKYAAAKHSTWWSIKQYGHAGRWRLCNKASFIVQRSMSSKGLKSCCWKYQLTSCLFFQFDNSVCYFSPFASASTLQHLKQNSHTKDFWLKCLYSNLAAWQKNDTAEKIWRKLRKY